MTTRHLLPLILVLLYNISFAQIEITSPSPNQKVYTKSIVPITWETGTNVTDVKIHYAYGGNSYYVATTTNNGQYDLDLQDRDLSIGNISFKVTAANDPRNYSTISNLPIEQCRIDVVVDIPGTNLCVGQAVIFVNRTTNATSYKWIANGKVLSTSKDLTFVPQNLEDTNIRLEAFNKNCYDYFYFDIRNKPSISNDGLCSNETVIEEMMIVDTNEGMQLTAGIPVTINEPVKAVALRMTHELKTGQKFLSWDWTKNNIPGFHLGNIDASQKGQVTITWTSIDPNGTLISGELYTLDIDVTDMMAPEPEIMPIGGRSSRGGGRLQPIPTKPSSAGKENLQYKKVVANDKFGANVTLKTTGVILTKDNVIILEQ